MEIGCIYLATFAADGRNINTLRMCNTSDVKNQMASTGNFMTDVKKFFKFEKLLLLMK